ncbi:MAG: phosphate regulon sensor histidine kinase PhoR [Betaproteobacteria bacterium]|nr:phosphate regulon sensor histidine kinase PhoR [Betaproteobacteria bacterium]
MNPIVRAGLVVPAGSLVIVLLMWAIAGPVWALGALIAAGAAIFAFHLRHLSLLTEWAAGPLDAAVPEGRGTWGPVFSALYRRVRTRAAYQRDLQQMIERFRNAADALPDGVVVLDTDNRIEWANPRALLQLGLNLKSDRGQPIVNFLREPEFIRYLQRGDYGEAVLVDSHRNRGATLSLQLVPFAADEKLLMSRDVTHLEAVARMRRDFIANVSHELKTPLTVISGFLETLQELQLDAKQRARFLQLMQEQAKSMQRLVEDLLTLSALESEQDNRAESPFAIVPLLLRLSADAKGLSQGQHTVALEIGAAATVLGSRDELASAFGNLVSNAIRYTPVGGTITLAWRVDSDGAGVFAVADTGIGIAPEHIPRLTERFYRVDRSRSRATGGTGLGLAIVKHVLLRHQAELEISSSPGKGSAFAVRLPGRRVERTPLGDDPQENQSAASAHTGAHRGTRA